MFESKQAQLRRRYPTMKKFNAAIGIVGSMVRLADNLKMHKQTLNNHMRYLKSITKDIEVVKAKSNNGLKNGELDARIKKMFGTGYEDVKVYKLTEEYVSGQTGAEGLVYLRTDVSPTALSLWERRSLRMGGK